MKIDTWVRALKSFLLTTLDKKGFEFELEMSFKNLEHCSNDQKDLYMRARIMKDTHVAVLDKYSKSEHHVVAQLTTQELSE